MSKSLEVKSDMEAGLLLEALEHFYYTAREAYADGSGNASPEQIAVGELQERARALIPGAPEAHEKSITSMEDAIAKTMSQFGVTGIQFGDGEEGFEWDSQGNVKR